MVLHILVMEMPRINSPVHNRVDASHDVDCDARKGGETFEVRGPVTWMPGPKTSANKKGEPLFNFVKVLRRSDDVKIAGCCFDTKTIKQHAAANRPLQPSEFRRNRDG